MRLKNKYVSTTLIGMSSLSLATVHAEKLSAWSAPQWGFVKPISLKSVSQEAQSLVPTVSPIIKKASAAQLSKSLIFDQSFDKVVYRPWVEQPVKNIVQNRSNSPEVVNVRADFPALSLNTHVSPQSFVKFAAVEAIRAQDDLRPNTKITQDISQNIAQMSGQSVAPQADTLDDSRASAASVLNQSDSESAYVSIYTRQDKILEKKLSAIEESLTQSAPAAITTPAQEVKKLQSTAPVQTLTPVSPIKAQEPIRLDGFVKDIPKTLAKNEVSPPETSSASTKNIESSEKSLKTNSESPHELKLTKLIMPQSESHLAKLVVIDEESLSLGDKFGIQNAEVHWIGQKSGLVTHTQKGGGVAAPYRSAQSMRFVVKAPGYLPAVGYVSQGLVSPVLLFKESRLAPVVRSLNIVPDPSRVMIFGKVLDRKGNPLSNVSIDTSTAKPFKVFYSLGSIGLFHPRALTTGPAGDFFVSGINHGIQYFMPTQGLNAENNFTEQGSDQQSVEWPAQIINLTGVGPIATITIQQSEQRKVKTQIVDAFALERPSGVGIQLTVGGQRGVHIPNEDGEIEIPDMYRRSSSDLIEVRAQGYIKSWVSGSAEKGGFPENIALFTQLQVDTLLAESLSDIQLSRGIVFGNLRPEFFKSSVEIRVFDSYGKKATQAKLLYFDDKNLARGSLTSTDPVIQNFAIANLNPGEWQVIAVDKFTQKAIGAQVIRVEDNTVSQLQF